MNDSFPIRRNSGLNIPGMQSARREMVTGVFGFAAIVMFIWTGGSAMSAVVRRLTGLGACVEQIMMTALLLNIALIIFGWRRYRDLQIEVQQRTEAEERASLLAATEIGRTTCTESVCTHG